MGDRERDPPSGTPGTPAPLGRTLAVIASTMVVYGMSFGVLARDAGLTTAQAIVMSFVVMNGAAQFAAVGALAAGGSAAAAVLAGAAVSARMVPLGLAAGRSDTRPHPHLLLAAHLLTDPGVAIGYRPDGSVAQDRLTRVGVVIIVFWTLGTAIGAVVGGLVTGIADLGLDAVYPALFLALLAEPLRSQPRVRRALLAGALITLLTYPLLPAGLPVAAGALGALAGMGNRGAREQAA